MPSYYNIVKGNLRTGDIALSSDINHIQQHIRDMISSAISDQYDNESFMLGAGEEHRYDFLLTPAQKFQGRYVDDVNGYDEGIEPDVTKYININRKTVKQPLLLTKTSVYSVITKLKNESNRNIEIKCELQDIDGETLRSNTLIIPAGTVTPRDFEIIFDLDFYPTAPNLKHEDLQEKDGKDVIPRKPDEESFDEGFIHDPDEEVPHSQFSAGVSQIYFVIHKTDLNETKIAENDTESTPVSFDPDHSLGVFYTETSINPNKNIYCQTAMDKIFSEEKVNIYFKEVYANEMTYLCNRGEAVIHGEKVGCIDSHVSIAGGNSYGNMLTGVYMDIHGHLKTHNYKASLTRKIEEFEVDGPYDEFRFPIALIFTYSNIYGIDKEPIVIQSQKYDQLPLSHHERLRRIEKQIDWINDIAIPARLKWTLTGEDILDKNDSSILGYPFTNKSSKNKEDHTDNYYLTTDANGNPVIRLSDAVVTTIPVTLNEAEKDKDGNTISLEENDIKNASYFSELKDMVHDSKEGTLKLKNKNADLEIKGVALTEKEAKITKLNPWDDDKSNRPADAKFKKHEREFTVYSGKNGKHDSSSEYPGMTLYCNSKLKLTKLNIPIYKFKNCSGIKFYIWERQSPNNKKNTVWLKEKLWTSKVFSLKKAKVKGDYQYMDGGFTIEFEDGGLSLPKGQYVIIGLPIPKSGEGSCYVETYEPKNPKDFLIRYYGAANASHFLLKTRYHEIWYNSASAEAIEEDYYTSGSAVSKTITWTEEGLQNIESIKPVVGKNLTKPDKCEYKLYADTGGGWQQLTPGKENDMVGGAKSFRWKIEFTSDGKGTPALSYNKENKYAIQFILTRAKAGASNAEDVLKKDKSMCLTTNPFDGDSILREYIGDPNFALTQSRFNQYEFARIWTDRDDNEKLLVDIQGSDRNFEFTNPTTNEKTTYPLWTIHYCDLTLDDFNQNSVDYSHYKEDVEYDENNLRLKLDSAHSYNDNDIAISSLQEFKKVPNSIDSTTTPEMVFINNSNVKTNQVFLRSKFANPKDLTQYTGLTFKFKMRARSASELKGVGIYISNNTNTQPTRLTEEDNDSIETLEDTEILPATLDPDTNTASLYEEKYKDKIIKIIHFVDINNDGNKAYTEGYYKYSPQYDNDSKKIIYVLEQIHDLKDYKIYNIGNLIYDEDKAIAPEVTVTVTDSEGSSTDASESDNTDSDNTETESEDTRKYMEVTVRIEIDQNSQVLKSVKEIGIVSLNDETDEAFKYSVTGSENGTISLELVEVRGLSEDYYPIFNPAKDINLWKAATQYVSVHNYNDIEFTKDTFYKKLNDQSLIAKSLVEMKKTGTSPATEQICIDYQGLEKDKSTQLCYLNNPYQGGLSNYKHLGIQIASDVYIPKDCIKIQLCESENGENPFVSVNLPTLNTVYNPMGDGNNAITKINLSQIFKKINSDKEIKSINILATKNFKNFMTDIVDENKGDHINIFLGKIVVYKAETIPMFHKKMRYKLYSAENGDIDHTSEDLNKSITIRKIGTVVDYS